MKTHMPFFDGSSDNIHLPKNEIASIRKDHHIQRPGFTPSGGSMLPDVQYPP